MTTHTRRTTTQPHRTAQAHHLRELIGAVVTIAMQPTRTAPAWNVRVRVLDAATPYGAARLLIAPLDSDDAPTWISADKLTDWPGRTAPAPRITDAGEKFADRYVVEFDNGDVYTMSSDANRPNGVCMYAGNTDDGTAAPGDGPELTLDQVPEGTRRQIERLQAEETSR